MLWNGGGTLVVKRLPDNNAPLSCGVCPRVLTISRVIATLKRSIPALGFQDSLWRSGVRRQFQV